MGLFILRIRVMHVVCDRQRDVQLPAHGKQGGVHQPLRRNPMILQLQEKIALAEAFLIFQRRLLRLVRKALLDVSRHLSRQTGGKGDDSLMVLLQHLHIHARLVIKAFREAAAYDLHQVGVSRVVLRQQHQMIIPVVPAACLSVKPGIRRNIHLAADDRFDPRFLRRPVKINDAVHHPMVGDGGAVHAKLLHPADVFLYLVGAVQQTVLRMNMKMRKCHVFL